MHFNCSHENIELLLRTVISENQVSIYGAIADLCNEVPKDLRALVKPAAPDHLEKMEIPTDHSVAENYTNVQQRRNLVQIRTNVRGPKIIQTRFWCRFEVCRRNDNTPILLKQKKDNRCNIYAENTRCLEMKRELV